MVTPVVPIARHRSPVSDRLEHQASKGSDLHLLVVDECLLLSTLSPSLRAVGFHVHCAASGLEALRVLHSAAIDLVLLDVSLPDTNGHALCTQIRRQFQLPVVVMSALRGPVDILLAFGAGADAYIQKPFQLRELVEKLQETMRKYAGC